MPAPKDKSHLDYAERVRARLPGALQTLREGRRMSRYALEIKCGISREMISKIEKGKSNPSFCTVAQMTHGLGQTVTKFAHTLEDGAVS